MFWLREQNLGLPILHFHLCLADKQQIGNQRQTDENNNSRSHVLRGNAASDALRRVWQRRALEDEFPRRASLPLS